MGMDSLSFWGCRNGRNGMKEDVLQTRRRRKFWDPHVFRELCRKSLLKLQDCDPSVILRERERGINNPKEGTLHMQTCLCI